MKVIEFAKHNEITLNQTKKLIKAVLNVDVSKDRTLTPEELDKLNSVMQNPEELASNTQHLSLPSVDLQTDAETEAIAPPTTEPQPETTAGLSVPQPQQLTTNPQSPIPNSLSLIQQLSKQASEEIAAIDAIAQVRNTLILNNLAVRDAELVEQLNQHWQYQKQEYLGAIRDLASLVKQPVETTPDEIDLSLEVDSIIGELGKKLVR